MLIMDHLMHRCLKVAGQEWLKQQELKAFRGEPRSYRMLEACAQRDLNVYFANMIRLLLRFPRGIEQAVMTIRLKLLCFRLVSRAMCSLHQLLRLARNGVPYALFTSLETGTYCDLPPCQWDALALQFRTWFPQFTTEARAALESLAELIDLDISTVESRHAACRRITVARGVQTWAPKLATTSAEYTLRQMVLAQASFGVKAEKEAQATKEEQPQGSAKKGGGGGSWNAFLHERAMGRRVDECSRSLAQEYRNLSDADKAYFDRQGQLGKLASRHGFAAFGARDRQRSRPSLPVQDDGAAALAVVELPESRRPVNISIQD